MARALLIGIMLTALNQGLPVGPSVAAFEVTCGPSFVGTLVGEVSLDGKLWVKSFFIVSGSAVCDEQPHCVHVGTVADDAQRARLRVDSYVSGSVKITPGCAAADAGPGQS